MIYHNKNKILSCKEMMEKEFNYPVSLKKKQVIARYRKLYLGEQPIRKE